MTDWMERLSELADPQRAAHSQRFFKTGPGEYAEGDRFLGIRVPELRKVAKTLRGMTLNEVTPLLTSEYHEVRLMALFVLVEKFEKGDSETRQQVFELYMAHTRYINNWDLVDSSAPQIVGGYMADKDRGLLYELKDSDDLWRRRIAVLACFYFIRRGDCQDVLAISEALLSDPHDLIHKATGWMLRETGKRDPALLLDFLDRHSKTMPRTMLRYSIEKLTPEQRRHYMAKD